VLHLPSKVNKESKAKKGIIKLMLLYICGDIDINSLSIMNVTLATPSKCMHAVLNQPYTARAGKFVDLAWMTLDLAKQEDYTNFHSSQDSIRAMSKVLVSCMLQVNFATKIATSLKIEAHSIKPSIFFPQKNACLVECEKNTEVKTMLEKCYGLHQFSQDKGQDHNLSHQYDAFHGQYHKSLHQHEYDHYPNLLQ
jgi:hypothetical protein